MIRSIDWVGGRHRPASHPPRHRWTAHALFTLAAALLVGAGLSVPATAPSPTELTQSEGQPSQASQASAEVRQQARKRAVPPPPAALPALPAQPPKKGARAVRPTPDPTSVRIPALGIHRDLVELGVIGTDLQVPDDYSDIGWWRDGPSPGENGAAVLVGHVDSPTGPAVFYQLSGMRPGHRIVVERENGSRMVFAVRDVKAFARNRFPSRHVYRTHGAPVLRLVTCGGTFDADSGHYTSNVVVFAHLVKRMPATQHPPRRHKEARKLPTGGDRR